MESCLVTYFIDELLVGNIDMRTVQVKLHDGAVDLTQSPDLFRREGRIDVWQIAQEPVQMLWWLWDRLIAVIVC